MRIDKTMAGLLSNLFLDLAKAYFIAAVVTPSLSGTSSIFELLFLLTKGMLNGIVFTLAAWYFARRKEQS